MSPNRSSTLELAAAVLDLNAPKRMAPAADPPDEGDRLVKFPNLVDPATETAGDAVGTTILFRDRGGELLAGGERSLLSEQPSKKAELADICGILEIFRVATDCL
jgi:hypothetical protein